MTDQYIYSQPVYGQEIHYQQGINSNDPTLFQGEGYETYEVTNYQQNAKVKTNTVNMTPTTITTTYQTYEQRQPIMYEQMQEYGQPVYIQQGQTGQNYEYQQESGVDITGYENYFQQIQQPQHQQQIIQENYQQPQSIAQQQANIVQQNRKAQQQAKIVQQMVQTKPNVKQTQFQNIKQNPSASRNPNIRQKYQQQQFQQQQYQQQQYQQQQYQQQQYQQQQYQQQQYQQEKYQQEQFQRKNSPNLIQGQIKPSNITAETYNLQQNQEKDRPIIDPDFQPEIPIANSVLNQSQIPFQSNVMTTPAYNPQIQPPPSKPKVIPQPSQNYKQSYVVPRRNPNMKIKQYEYINNDLHFVTTKDPGSRTVPYNLNEKSNISKVSQNPNIKKKVSVEQSQNQNIMKKVSGEQSLSHKDSNISEKSLKVNNQTTEIDRQYEDQLFNTVGSEIANTKILDNVESNGIQNLGENRMDNTGVSVMKSIDPNVMESKKITNEEIEKENPIEEKVPDQSIVNNNPNEDFPQEGNLNKFGGNEIVDVDIDDQLSVLPTIDNILKGNADLLPPPRKKKYQF